MNEPEIITEYFEGKLIAAQIRRGDGVFVDLPLDEAKKYLGIENE